MRTIVVLLTVGAIALAQPQPNPQLSGLLGGGSGGLLGGLLNGLLGAGGSGGGLLGGLLQGLGLGGGGGGLVGGLVNSLGLGNVLGPVDVRLPLQNITDKLDDIIESMHFNTLTILYTGDKIDRANYAKASEGLEGDFILKFVPE